VPHLGLVTLVVRDHSEAIGFYVGALGFDLIEDTPLGDGKRWIVVALSTSQHTRLLLARAATPEQFKRIGDQTGGRVFLFLYSNDFGADHDRLRKAGVHFVEQPRSEPYGRVAGFEDIYGNRWDLIETKET
jgi:catechol 2,3-dioxygenase-like lactoylglutathione lyase family enzyme